jgi:hypothetical protein
MPPRGKAPGLKRGRNRQPYWIARQVVRDPMDFPDNCIPLPAGADGDALAKLCHQHTARLQSWLAEQKQRALADAQQAGLRTRYSGTIHVLRLALSGAPDRHPRLKLIIGHVRSNRASGDAGTLRRKIVEFVQPMATSDWAWQEA